MSQTDDKTAAEGRRAGELQEQREEFLETFFRKGAEFATELIDEVQGLRDKVAALSEENIKLRHQLASDDAIRELLTKIEALESEKASLSDKIRDVDGQRNDFVGRYAELEKELDQMAALYVASYQLHATMEPSEVLGVIEQLLAQLVGAADFVIYIRRDDDGAQLLEPIYAYCHDAKVVSPVRFGEGAIGEAASTQVHSVADPGAADRDGPLACIPMVLASETVGVIVIFDLFEQKSTFVDIDFEFFKLLALHAASAIVGAGLLAGSGGTGASLNVYERL